MQHSARSIKTAVRGTSLAAVTALAMAGIFGMGVASAVADEQPQITVEGQQAQYEDMVLQASPQRIGDETFKCVRIPAIDKVNGVLIASWNPRTKASMDGKNPCGDYEPGNSIWVQTSTDDGKTWGHGKLILDGDKGGEGHDYYLDPSVVVDSTTNKIFVSAVKTPKHLAKSFTSEGFDAVIVEGSVQADGSIQWQPERNVTSAFTTDELKYEGHRNYLRWGTAGAGIEWVKDDTHRLIMPYVLWYQEDGVKAVRAVSLYSDDHGATWKTGTPVGTDMDENRIVALADGTIMLNSRKNSRPQNPSDPIGRYVAVSHDGGVTYTDLRKDDTLIDPRNNASLIRAFPKETSGPKSKVLLFSNARSNDARENGTISVSFDNGKTWPVHKTFRSSSTAYTSLISTGDGQYAMLYEEQLNDDNYNLRFATFNWAWLMKPQDFSRIAGVDRVATSLRLARQEVFKDSTSALLVNGTNGVDALGVGPLATELKSPLLLNGKDALDKSVEKFLKSRKNIKTVYLAGGTAALSDQVKADLEKLGLTVIRISGEDRFSTATAVAKKVMAEAKENPVRRVFLADGKGQVDALGSAVAAGRNAGVVLLTNGEEIPQSTADFLAEHKDLKVIAVGGQAVRGAEAAGIKTVQSIAGADRYATALELAKIYSADSKRVWIASGISSADALSSGPAVALEEGALVLSSPQALAPEVKQWIGSKPVTVLGGNAAVSDAILD